MTTEHYYETEKLPDATIETLMSALKAPRWWSLNERVAEVRIVNPDPGLLERISQLVDIESVRWFRDLGRYGEALEREYERIN